MHRTIPFLLLAAASALAPACGHSPVAPDSASWLFGQWTWVQSTGGLAGGTRTPATEGFSLELEFQRDGDLLIYRNGSLQTRSWFEVHDLEEGALLQKGAAILGTEDQLVVLIDEHLGRPEPWDQDAMALVERCNDCFVHEFVRAP